MREGSGVSYGPDDGCDSEANCWALGGARATASVPGQEPAAVNPGGCGGMRWQPMHSATCTSLSSNDGDHQPQYPTASGQRWLFGPLEGSPRSQVLVQELMPGDSGSTRVVLELPATASLRRSAPGSFGDVFGARSRADVGMTTAHTRTGATGGSHALPPLARDAHHCEGPRISRADASSALRTCQPGAGSGCAAGVAKTSWMLVDKGMLLQTPRPVRPSLSFHANPLAQS
jgi:hypothetical protein